MNDANYKVAIIGAGLTGLTTAYYLKKNNIPFVLYEQSNRTGGVIQTFKEDGFTYESGPNTGSIGNPEIAELFEELSGECELEIANPKAKKRLIWKDGKWNALPSGLLSAITTPLFAFSDKLRILGEPFRKKGSDPLESVANMTRRRLGKSFLNYAIDPFVAGIYSGDPEYLVTKYALPKMHLLEANYGSLIRGGIKKSKANKADPRMAKATREVFSVKGGLSNLISALERKIGSEDIKLESKDIVIETIKNKYNIKYQKENKSFCEEFDAVITTTGAYTLKNMLPFISESKLSNITQLKYAQVVLMLIGYKTWKGIDINAFGGLVPSIEKRKILGVLFTSSFFNNRAPKNGAILSMFIGGTRLPGAVDLPDDELKNIARDELKDTLSNSDEPDLFKIIRYPYAIAQYGASTKERIEKIESLEKKHQGLFLGGNIRNGIGMSDRVKQGRDIAEQIIQRQKTLKLKK